MRPGWPITLAFVILVPTATRGAEPNYALRTTPAQQIEAVNTYELKIPGVVAKEWFFYAAGAPELPCQTKVSATMDPGGKVEKDLTDFHRPILVGHFAVKDKSREKEITYRVTYKATLIARELVTLPPGAKRPTVAPLRAEDRKLALQTTKSFFDFEEKSFQDWLTQHDLRRKKNENDIDFARRTFLTIKKNFTYEARNANDRHATAVCQAGKSDCGGLSNVFVSTMRANGIPARCLQGKWAMSATPGATVGDMAFCQQHVKAEFFADGVGWVPVDQSAAVVHDKTPAGLEYFGKDRGDFIVFLVDYDVTVDSGKFGKQTVPWFWFTCWVTGGGNTDNRQQREDWQVRKVR